MAESNATHPPAPPETSSVGARGQGSAGYDPGESTRSLRRKWSGSGGVGSIFLYLAGVAAAVALLYFMVHEGAASGAAINVNGLIIVAGGVTIAALLSFDGADIRGAIVALITSMSTPTTIDDDAMHIVETARRLRRSIRDAEDYVQRIPNLFLRLALQMVVDGVPLDDMMNVLSWRIEKDAESENVRSRLFRTLGACAPAFGLLGTIVGMVGMLGHLADGNLSKVGSGMATAMLSTFYGLVLAFIIFKPAAIKLEQKTREKVAATNLLLEAIALVRLGRSPSMIAETLEVLSDNRRGHDDVEST
jgi:chemotaxis protein MotA